MIQPLPPSGTNIQRWGLVRLVKYPSVDHLGNARDASLLQNVRWLILHDWKETLKADNGTFSWGEIYKGWGLCIVEGQPSTLTAISNDPRATIRVLPQKNLTDNLTAGQITTINGWLLNMGMDQTEIDGFNLSGRSVAQIFNWLNRGICGQSFDGANIIEDHTKIIGFARSVDSIVEEFNRIKENPLIDPNPDVGLLDDFARADEALNAGANWAHITGSGWNIVTGEIRCNAANGNYGRETWVNSNFSGQVQVALTCSARDFADSNAQMRLIAKDDDGNPNSGYYLNFKWQTGSVFNIQFIRRTTGTDTALGTANSSLTFAVGSTLYAKFDNDASGTLTAYVNGVQQLQTTDTTYKDTSGRIAIEGVRNTTNERLWDDFVGGTFVPPTTFNRLWKQSLRPRPFAPGLAR